MRPGDDCAADEVGELWLRSEVVTPGYWQQPRGHRRRHHRRLVPHRRHGAQDDEGFYYVVDRKKNMFISGGENVYPAEVEAAAGRPQAIEEAAVIGVPHPKWGETGHAFLVLQAGPEPWTRRPSRGTAWSVWPSSRFPSTSLLSRSCPATTRARSTAAPCVSSPTLRRKVTTMKKT